MSKGKTAFLFTGQGAQYPGMMKDIYENVKTSRIAMDTANKVLCRPIRELCFEGEQEDLNLTENTQPCMLAADLTAYYAFANHGIKANHAIKPDMVAGFSLGEYAAMVAAGAMPLEDALSIVQLRASAMQDAVPVGQGAMAAIRTGDKNLVNDICASVDGYVAPANYNSPEQIVVSGEKPAIRAFTKEAKARGVKATRLPVSAPFHCEMMKPAAEQIAELIKKCNMSDAALPVYTNCDAKPTIAREELRHKLIKQITSPVHWEQTIKKMYDDGARTFIEFGPSDTLTKFTRLILEDDNVRCFNICDMETLGGVTLTE